MTTTATHLAAMPMTISIDVTADDITKGRKCAANSCPVALAIIRAMQQYRIYSVSAGPWNAHVDQDTGARDGSGYTVVQTSKYQLPADATNFINAYDQGEHDPLPPFSFEMELVDAYTNYR
jgi:hypothetical protein